MRKLDAPRIGIIAANADGSVFVSNHIDGKIRLWTPDGVTPSEEFDVPDDVGITALAVETEYDRVIAGVTVDGRAGRLIAWDFGERAPQSTVDLDLEVSARSWPLKN